MFDANILSEMTKKFIDSLPPHLKTLHHEIEAQLRPFLQQCFLKMDLVTREEFDIQVQVLAKTRAKLEALEEILQRLEMRP